MPTVGTPKHGEGFLRGERGTAMVVALVMLSLLSILGLSAISSTVFTLRTSANYRQSVDALLIAEAGLEHAKSVLRSLPFKQALAGPDGNPATLGDNGIIFASETVAFRNGAYTVRVTDNDDGDNDPSRDRDQRVIITSTGKLNDSSARKVITALVSKANLATPPAAVSVLDAQYELDFRGNSFTIEGKDRNPDGSAGPEPAINGMAVEAPQPSAAEIDGFFDAQAAKNNITGSGGASPDIAFGDTPLQLDEVRQTRERLIQMAN
ncbi:MAG: hypothetical protein HYY96_10975, partial [Candidatus Tectomicrobia bacterium]|nr:hypothetical protein [Candidatus Tectomicrobia bacterium]